MSNIEEKLKSLQNVLIERGYNATTQNEKADLRSKLKSLQDVLIKRGYTPKSVSSQEDSLFGKTSKSTFETMPKYQENKQKYQKEKEDKLNAMYDKYGINPEKFSYGDFEKWAKNHNFEYQLVGDTPQNTRRVLAPKKDEKGASLASNEEISDKNTLEQLAENNDRRKTSNSDKGSMGAFALKAMDGMTLGAYSKLSDKQTKKKYEEAGLNPNEVISDTQAYKKTFDDHKIASNLGDLAGSTVSLIGLGEVVGGALKGVKWLAKAPTWVQSAVKEGITFGLKQGTETAIDGGGAKDIAKETAIGVAGGAAGGATSSVVGKVGEDVLFKTRLQNKIIPEIIKNGTASASFAGADSAATYFLHPKEERPTAGDIAKNIGVTFAFAAITTGINAGRIKQSSKEALDVVNDKMMKDYESMMNSASTNDVESVKQFAKNVMDYSDSMIKYLDGEGFKLKNDAPSDTVTEYLTGKGNAPVKDTVLEKARFVGEDARVRSMQEDLRTIKSRAKEFYDRVDSIPYDVEKISKTSNVGNVDNVTKEPININHTKSTSQTENLIQNVPKTSGTEPIQTVQEQTPVNIKTSNVELRKTDELSEEVQDNTSKADVITENNQKQFNENQRQQNNVDNQADLSDVSNSKINVDNATINNTTDKINGADTLNMVDTVSNDTKENGVQSSVNQVTEEVYNAMNKVGLNVSESATGIQEANTKFMSNNDNLFDRNYVSNYANDFVQAMSEKSGHSYTVLSQETDNLADELVNKTLTGNSVLDGNREFQTVVRNFKDVLREGIKKNTNLHNNVYGANEVLNAQVQDIENGDYSSLNITENPNNNVTFAPITENEQNIGYVIERDNGYSNELSESDFTVKQKNGEYGTRNGITYGHFGTHQNSNGNNIVSYLPTGNAVAILPNQNSAIEFMKQAENETSGYSIYLYDDNGVTKTGGDMSQFINALNITKNSVQVEQNAGNIGMQNNTGVLNNAESENISSQAPNIDENINTVRTDDTVKSIEISAEDKIPGLLQDEYSDLLSLEDRTALDTLGSAIGVPIKIVPTISNDANGCYYKGVIYISLSADDKVMTVFSHELTHYLEDTLDYTEYKKCVLDFIQKNTDKSIDELAKEKVDTYAKSSINLTYEEATREIVADYTQNILKDADAVMEFVDSIENKEQRRGVIRRLLDAIKELINKIKAKFSSKHSQMQELQKTHDLLEDMLKEAAENIGSNNGSKTRYSYAGTKAETANITQLSRAKEMELNGEKAETIRAKTGWNRGLDGKWRFEIDDSKMEFDKGGITSNPDVARKKELEMKFINGTITEQEQSELNGLINTTKEVRKPSVLQDYIKHDELFRAYPFLKTVDVEFDTSMQKGEHGKYTPSLNTITLNAYDSSNQDKSTLIHEIQHAIQHYEGFATGANVEYWKVKNGQDIESLEREIRKNSRVLELYQDAANNVFDKLVDFDDFEDKTGLDFINLFDEDNMKKSKAYLKEKLPEGLYEVSEGYIDRGKEYAEKYISLMKKLRTLKEQTAMDLYKNTAGEIEARDVQNRMNMTEEERKNTFPESMKKNGDVVFANAMNNRDTEYAKEQSDSNSESDKNVKYSFGGKNSKTADIGLLKQAENLEKDGASAEEIRKETGWSRGLDNKWKFEIDDSQAKYNEDKIRLGKAVSLNEVLEHKDLFKAYPDLKKVKVKEISNLDANGIYSPNFDCIFINENLPTQEKLKSLIHEVQHAIQVREGFAVGESPDNKNRNQSAGEIEADDVKARQSMSKEERLNTFPKSMKPNQNADVAFWENSKSNEYGDVNIDEDMGIRYNDDIDIPYREKKQLDEYVISANNRANKLKTLDYKEIGNNFYIWRNNSKTDFKVLMQIEIDGNEDFIDNLREELYNEETKEIDTSAEGFTAWVEDIQSGRGVYNSNNVDDTEGISNRNDDRLYDKSRKSNARRTTIQSNGNQQIEGEISLKNLNNNPNQIKSATGNIGTFDKNNADIRYSIKKNETDTDKNLVAIHNLSEKKLKENLALGGFPAPSIAVTKADIGHNGYGDISVIFGRDTIDPTKSSDNRLYSADAYTSTFPQVDYKLNEDALNRLSEHLNMSVSQLESNIFDTGDKERIISKMKASEQVREAFVKDNNFKVEPVLRDPKPSKFGTNTNEAFYLLANHVTYEQLVNNADVRNDYFEAVEEGSKLKGATKRFIEKMNKQLDAAKNKPEIFEREQARFNDDMKILNGQGEKVEDTYSHSDGVNNVIKENQSEFNNYAKNLVDKVLEDKYIRKDIDPFDEYGNGRDFSEMHTEYTLENIVRAMSKGKNQENGIFGAGIGEMRSAVSQEYKTVEDMKKDSGRIQKLSDEEIDNIYSKSEKLLGDITSDLAQLIDTGNNFTDIDVASENVKNALLKGTNKRSIKRYLAEYINGVSDTTIDKIVELADNLKNIPVKYFEAKPHRAIGFDEVKAVILPDNVDPNLNQQLKDMGINTVKYKSGDEADRQRALESVDGNVRFSHTVGNKAEGKASTVHSVSKKLISDYGVESKVKPSDISEAIADITSKINDTYYGEGDINRKYAKLEKAAYGVAEKIVDQMKKKDNYAEEIYNNLRKEIKSTKIRISEVDKGDFTEWNDFRKQNFGYLTLSNKEGIPVDSYYKELAQEYPGMFDESTHMVVGDQLRNIVDTLRDLKPKEYDLSTEERNEMLEEVANEVILRSINLADDMGYIDKNGNADKIYTESDMRGALDKQKERLNNKHEKQLDRQKERLENKYEKRLETQKTKYIEQREKIRKQLIDKVNQQKEKAKARKKESEDRTKLLKLAREINSMKLSPQDKNKLPDILKEIDTVSKGILKKGYTTKDGKTVMGELDLKQLKEDYELLKQDENFLPDKDVELKISRLDKMQIADMNINDVRDLIQTLQEVKHEIRTKDKMINDVRNREIAHIAVECIKEIQHSKGIEDDRKGARYRGYISTHLTPERMFRRLSGYAKNGVFEGLAKDLSDGQRKSMTFKQRASEKFGKFTEKETEKMSKFTGKKAELIDISKYDTQGRKVYITPDMRVSLYLHSKNYSNLKHIQYGGITIPNWNLYKQGKIKEAYESAGITIRLTPSQVNEITKQMTPFEKSFADVAYNFFNVDCTKAINETSLALKGYEIATVKDYFPIVSDENFVNKDFETLVKNGTLEAKGMLKERKNAANPVRLESVIRVINRHMENVGDYYGLAIPIRNFNKVYNSMGKNYNYSVKQSLKQKWGSKADDYIKHLITDLQGGRKTDITLFDILKGNYAQAVLTLNAGVVFQQTASYPLAAAIVGYKALAKAFTERVTKADIEIINKHTPLLWYRSQGYTTTELGDYANGNFEDWTKKGKMPWLMGAIQAMDILTTTKLWKAAEFYVRDNYKELEQGTDEYYDKVADVYNRIIENTQPNYSIMQRPDVLRNPNALIKALTMFKTVTLQCFNLVYDAYGEYRARYREYQANKTKESAENLKSSSRKLGTTISALIVSILTLGVFKGVGRYTKGKFQDYYGDADNDNEIAFKSLMLAYGADIFNGIAGNAIGGSEVASLVEYILSIFDIGNAVWYDVQAPALDTVNGVVGGITKLLLTIEKNGLSNPHAYVKAVIKLLETLGNATGVPVKNAKDLIYGISKDITDVTHTKNIFDILE